MELGAVEAYFQSKVAPRERLSAGRSIDANMAAHARPGFSQSRTPLMRKPAWRTLWRTLIAMSSAAADSTRREHASGPACI
jgi:hypothetical protein